MTEAKAGAGNTGQGRSGAGSSQLHVHSTASPVYAQGRVVGQVRRYRATIAEIRRHGRLLNHKNYGRQLCLHLDGWTVTRPGEPAAARLPLFGGGL